MQAGREGRVFTLFLPPHRWLEKVGSIAGSMKGLEFSEWWGVGGRDRNKKRQGWTEEIELEGHRDTQRHRKRHRDRHTGRQRHIGTERLRDWIRSYWYQIMIPRIVT